MPFKFYFVWYGMKQQNERHTQEQRHMAQLIRRRMTQKVKPSGKTYNRKNKSYDKEI